MDLALNNLQKLICYKTQPTNQPNRTSGLMQNKLGLIYDNVISVYNNFSFQSWIGSNWYSQPYRLRKAVTFNKSSIYIPSLWKLDKCCRYLMSKFLLASSDCAGDFFF